MALGIGAVALFPQLPPLWTLALLLLPMAAAWRWRSLFFPAALCAGLAWGIGFGHYLIAGLLPVELEQQPLRLEGEVRGLVEQRELYGRPAQRFEFAISHCSRIDGSPCLVVWRRRGVCSSTGTTFRSRWPAANGGGCRPG